ncbi:MAG: hypothetical protein QMC85_05245 [Methanocellales archaeon]|nr:hypothetical protein [Methanocellales archaeon]MDI6902462.1 hypothetical protein [Methanocellales archaeon]
MPRMMNFNLIGRNSPSEREGMRAETYLYLRVLSIFRMPSININVDEETLWRFRELKLKFRAKNNLKFLKKLMELAEECN